MRFILRCRPAVSYTHLDVYKRQGENNLSTFAAYKAGLTEDTTTGTTFYDDVDTLTAQVDVEFIQQQYGTASIGYLIFLPVEGASYSILHYLEAVSYTHLKCARQRTPITPNSSLLPPNSKGVP